MNLADDQELQQLLAGGDVRWRRLIHHRVVDSTNDLARRLLGAGEDPGLVVVADLQTAGRGRRGRHWVEQEGPAGPTNLAVTASFAAPPDGGTWVPLAAGLAVAAAYRSAGAHAALKWPNDVLLGGRKAAGILVERHTVMGRDVLLVGCGLDLDWRGVPRNRPVEGRAWTSLAEELGRSVERAPLVASLLVDLERRLATGEQDGHALLDAYRAACDTLGRQVQVLLPDGQRVAGRAVDLDHAGRLVVEGPSGRRVLGVGDVAHVRAPRGG